MSTHGYKLCKRVKRLERAANSLKENATKVFMSEPHVTIGMVDISGANVMMLDISHLDSEIESERVGQEKAVERLQDLEAQLLDKTILFNDFVLDIFYKAKKYTNK